MILSPPTPPPSSQSKRRALIPARRLKIKALRNIALVGINVWIVFVFRDITAQED